MIAGPISFKPYTETIQGMSGPLAVKTGEYRILDRDGNTVGILRRSKTGGWTATNALYGIGPTGGYGLLVGKFTTAVEGRTMKLAAVAYQNRVRVLDAVDWEV